MAGFSWDAGTPPGHTPFNPDAFIGGGAVSGEFRGVWDASSGSFPADVEAASDWYSVSVAGTVDSVAFEVGDVLVALVDEPSTTTFAANWTRPAVSPDRPIQFGDGTFTESGDGSTAWGYANASGSMVASAQGTSAFGRVSGAGSAIEAGSKGSTAFGYASGGGVIEAGVDAFDQGSTAFGFASGAGAIIRTNGPGGFAAGNARTGGSILANAGGLAFGGSYGGGQPAVIRANNQGALAFGYASSGAEIYANGAGSLAGGYMRYHGQVVATRAGFAFGYAFDTGSVIDGAASGAMAVGVAYGGGILRSNGNATRSFGHARGAGASILASGNGAGAYGYAAAGEAIEATAANSFQFGVGTNAQADSLSVGVGPRLKGTDGAPGTPRNGDLWVASSLLTVRSDGITFGVRPSWLWEGVSTKVAAFTPSTLADAGWLFVMDGDFDFTIPANATVAHPVGTQIGFLLAEGHTGNIVDEAGVTLNGETAGAGSLAMTPHQLVVATKLATDQWNVSGV